VAKLNPGTQTEKNTGRLEAFSDGVFAIAITLLVLELKVPHLASGAIEPTPDALAESLATQWPAYFSFVTSFFSILIMWVHHHTLFRLVRQTDARLLFANGLVLLMVSVVPFPTAVVAEYFGTAASAVACEFYCGVFLFVSSAFYLLLLAALRKDVLLLDVPPATVRRLRRSYALGPPMYLLAGVAALLSSVLSLFICTGLWILWAVMTQEECTPPVLEVPIALETPEKS
jgi:uncharacterized membrane protein